MESQQTDGLQSDLPPKQEEGKGSYKEQGPESRNWLKGPQEKKIPFGNDLSTRGETGLNTTLALLDIVLG